MSKKPKSPVPVSVAAVAKTAATQDTEARKNAVVQGTPSLGSVQTMDSFVNFASKLGMGADNVMTESTYGFNPISRNRILLEWIYRGSWLGGVAVDLVADDMTRMGIEFKTDLTPDDQDLIEECVDDFDIWNKVNETIKWGRLYGGALCVMLIDGQDLRTPLREETILPGQFKGVAVFDRWMVEPDLNDMVTELGPDLGLPKFYRVLPSAPCLRGQAIHHSRIVLRAEGVKLPYQQRLVENMWGLSVIERLYDRLVSFDSATTGAAQLVYKSYIRTLKVEGLRELVSMGGKAMEGLATYMRVMGKYQGIEGVTMIDGKDEYTSEHHGAFSGLSDILTQFGQQISGALQIPLVRLFGQSPSGLNSTGDADIRMYYDNVKQAQNKELKTGMTKLYKVMAASNSIRVPPNFRIEFKSLWQMSDTEKADVAGKITETVVKAKEAGLVSDQAAMKELRQAADVTGVFTNITDEDISRADTEITPPGIEGLLPGMEGAVNGQPGAQGAEAAVPEGTQGGGPVPQPAANPGTPDRGADQGVRPHGQ